MPKYELSLQDYWRVIRKRRWIIIAIFIITVVPTVIYAQLQPPLYKAEAEVAVTERKTFGTAWMEVFYYTPGDPMKSYAETITSQAVIKRAAVRLKIIPPDAIEREILTEDEFNSILTIQSTISAKVREGTNKIVVSAITPQPDQARDYVNATAHSFEEYNLAVKTEKARKTQEDLKRQIEDNEQRLKAAETSLHQLREKHQVYNLATAAYNHLENLKKERDGLLKKYTPKHPDVIQVEKQIELARQELSKYSEDEIVFSRLQREVEIRTTIDKDLRSKYASLSAEAIDVPDVKVVNEAHSGEAIPLTKGINILAGVFIGLILGIGLAFVTEHLDTSLGTIEEIENLLKLPVLGVIPCLTREKNISSKESRRRREEKDIRGSRSEMIRSQLIFNFSSLSPLTESYRILRTNVIKNNTPANGGKVIVVTSTGPEEGKTVTTINLAITMAQKGERVLLVDTDMRKAIIHKVFGINKDEGLSDLLMGTRLLSETTRDITDSLMGGISYETITRTPGIDNLHIITAGSSVPHPVELLGSFNLDELFKGLKTRYNYILLDCAPVLPVTDVLILGPKADAVLLVYRAGKTAKSALVRAVDQLKNAQIAIRGIILNYITPEIEVSPTYYYHYYKYYPSESGRPEEARGKNNP